LFTQKIQKKVKFQLKTRFMLNSGHFEGLNYSSLKK